MQNYNSQVEKLWQNNGPTHTEQWDSGVGPSRTTELIIFNNKSTLVINIHYASMVCWVIFSADQPKLLFWSHVGAERCRDCPTRPVSSSTCCNWHNLLWDFLPVPRLQWETAASWRSHDHSLIKGFLPPTPTASCQRWSGSMRGLVYQIPSFLEFCKPGSAAQKGKSRQVHARSQERLELLHDVLLFVFTSLTKPDFEFI